MIFDITFNIPISLKNEFEKNVFVIDLTSDDGAPPAGLLITREVCSFAHATNTAIKNAIDCKMDKAGGSNEILRFILKLKSTFDVA